MRKHEENKSKSEKKYFPHSESGTATVIGAVMLLGIIFSVLTFAWVECVPEWKNDAEYSHMDSVWGNMAELKSRIDMMSIVMASNYNSSDINSSYSNSSTPKLVTSVPFHMGGGDIPFVGSMKSSGTLAVNKGKCVISIILNRENADPYIKSIVCGAVTYTSKNNNYVDQVFSYENGALILNQAEQPVMMLYPSIHFSNVSTSESNDYNVSINTVSVCKKLYSSPEIISSNSECSLRLTGIDYISIYDSEKDVLNSDKKGPGNVTTFTLIINSNYPEAWQSYLNKTMEDAKIGSDKYNTNKLGNNVRLTFYMTPDTSKGNTNKVKPDILKKLYVSKTEIKAEPGIGLK